MIADHSPSASQNPQGVNGIPFLGIGADSRRGNGGPVGRISPYGGGYDTSHSVVRIWDVANTTGSAALMYNYAIAQWPSATGQMVPRMLFVALYHEGLEHSTTTSPGLHRHWNWNVPESFFHPGADIAYIDAEDVSRHCPAHPPVAPAQPHVDRSVVIDWGVLYRCMSDKGLFDKAMPTSQVNILGVHWAIEVAGPGSLMWASVHGMRMSTDPSTAAFSVDGTTADDVGEAVIPAEWRDPVTTEQIRSWFWDSCRQNEACWRDNAERASGEPYSIDYGSGYHTLGVARDLALWPRSTAHR
jgi:hypothetical protein